MYSLTGAIGAALNAMTAGGGLGFLARTAVLFVAAYLVFGASVERPRSLIALTAGAVAGIASACYHALWLLFGIPGLPGLGVLLGMVAVWVATLAVSDRMLALGLEKSSTLTASIAGPSLLVWLIIGVLLTLARV